MKMKRLASEGDMGPSVFVVLQQTQTAHNGLALKPENVRLDSINRRPPFSRSVETLSQSPIQSATTC